MTPISAGDGLVFCSDCEEPLESVIFGGEIRAYCRSCDYEKPWLDMLEGVGAVPVKIKIAVAPNVTVEVTVEKDLPPGSMIVGSKGKFIDIEKAEGEANA
ncbi:hypothetical protein LCGC14_0393950 [marine sediment metagenome]|uniref:Uncharacterized protein n=1 Tax=marine sediment metagenome TaxID=412755 RepID=A0A0F9SYQ7_9ZZZZ